MKPSILLVLLAIAVSGCATSTASSLPVCDGKHRRPANPHGSVLEPSSPAAASAPTPGAGAEPPSSPQPGCGA